MNNINFSNNTSSILYDISIKKFDKLDNNTKKMLLDLIEQCDGYEPFYNCGYPQFACFDASLSTMLGFLSYLPNESNNDNNAASTHTCTSDTYSHTLEYEITALVSPNARKKGIFSSLLTAAKNSFADSDSIKLYCALPEYLISCTLNKGLFYKEYLMQFSYENFLTKQTNDLLFANSSKNLEYYFSDDATDYLAYINNDSVTTQMNDINVSNDIFDNNMCEPICVCRLDYQPSFTNIYGVYTELAFRHQGIATSFINNLIYDYFTDDDLSQNQHNPLILNVCSSNKYAVLLYRSCGFQEINCVSYYHIN